MVPPFDTFRVDKDGSLLWREAAHTLEDARARVDILAKSESAVKYVIRSQRAGHTVTINCNDQGESAD